MIKISFSIKRKTGGNNEELGKISSIGLHFIDQPDIQQGVVRLTNLKADTFNRIKNGHPVIGPDGLGIIKDYVEHRDKDDKIALPDGVNIRTQGKSKIYYNLNSIYVVDIIDVKSGTKYPAKINDYPLLLIDDTPVDFVLDLSRVAQLSIATRRKLANIKIFAKKYNGINVLNELISKKIWNPIK